MKKNRGRLRRLVDVGLFLMLSGCVAVREEASPKIDGSPPAPEAPARDGLRWTFTSGELTPQARAVVDVLRRAAEAGLDPREYDVPASPVPGSDGRDEFDRALDLALARYARDVSVGQVDPAALGIAAAPRRPSFQPGALLIELAGSADPEARLRTLEPPLPIYDRLRAVLQGLGASASVARREGSDASPPAYRIALSLERLRWLPVDRSNPPIVINVPEYRLRGIGEDGGVGIEMDVVVGTAVRWQTPLFSATLEQVEFNPAWMVPVSIARGELVPRIARDPGYLQRAGFEIVDRGTLDLATALDRVARGRLSLRQAPGPRNALGRVKFVLPNPYSIYLHDTPSRAVFEASRRDFSHGCIRVADPRGLAGFVLRRDPAWPSSRIDEAWESSRTERVPVVPGIPVHIVYLTATVTREGELRLFDDVYGHDARLAAALQMDSRAATR